MLYKQVFKTRAGADKRVAFERAHVRDGSRGNVNYRFYVIRCIDGVPDNTPFNIRTTYDYRIAKTLSDHPPTMQELGQ